MIDSIDCDCGVFIGPQQVLTMPVTRFGSLLKGVATVRCRQRLDNARFLTAR
jgi:hypothetical protein